MDDARMAHAAKPTIVAPLNISIEDVVRQPAWTPFRVETIEFVHDLSATILRGSRFRNHPELMAFAHEMRKRKVLDIAETLTPLTTNGVLRGRGLAVHFAPANVDTIFLYSLLLSLLAGNTNIVRISSKPSEQVERVIEVLLELFSDQKHDSVRQRLALVRYPHDNTITQAISSYADLRIIWGGDKTVNLIRAMTLSPLAKDVAFPDRWSFAVIDASVFLKSPDQSGIAREFANDSYWFAQMACSSPRLIAWRGQPNDCKAASDIFYTQLRAEAHRHSNFLSSIDFVNKRVFEDEAAIDNSVSIRQMSDNFVSVIQASIDELPDVSQHCGGGMFLDCTIESLEQLCKIINKKAQTVVSYGVGREEWAHFLKTQCTSGIDRIVHPGSALAFGPVWDGMSLMREFTKETTITI